MDLTDEQWAVLEPLIGGLPRRADGRGRPWRSSRETTPKPGIHKTRHHPLRNVS